MAEFRIISSLREIDRDAWNACFASELEDYVYLLATEESGMPGFSWRYVIAQEDKTILAAMPAFLTDYALDTTLEGAGRKITGAIQRVFPGALTLKLACLGSPVAEYGLVGFHSSVSDAQKPSLLAGMLEAFESHATEQNHGLVGLKDIPAFQQAFWENPMQRFGYRAIGGLPVATLDIDFATMDEYFEKLSHGTRKDMRRKLKAQDQVRIEHRTTIDDVLPQVMALYRATRARGDMQFEDLTEKFFTDVLHTMPDRSLCTLYYVGDDLLAANLLLKNETTLLDKFFCMDARGRDYNLYFLSWFTNVGYCLEHGLKRYQSGQAGYENKLRLGSRLTPTTMVFKHRNRFIQGALRLAAPLLAADVKEAA